MYKCRPFNVACSQPLPEHAVCYTEPVMELQFVPTKVGNVVSKKLEAVKTKVSEHFSKFKFDDFRLENLQAAGVELRPTTLGVDADSAARQINELGEKLLDVDSKISKEKKSELPKEKESELSKED